MPSIQENTKAWNSDYDWPQAGDEWSAAWGGTQMLWHWVIRPRIHEYLPSESIVEIAPGYGRWTSFLLREANRLVAVDISETCIEACRKRFSAVPNVSFFVNDGLSLSCIEDRSADFIFSFDSLVHAESSVIESYVGEIAKKLSNDGVAFIHHSNMGNYLSQMKFSRIPKLRALLRYFGLLENHFHWRALSMTAEKMVGFAQRHQLQCITQELVNWGTRGALIDCFSVLTHADSKWARPSRTLRNNNFMQEAGLIKKLSFLYNKIDD